MVSHCISLCTINLISTANKEITTCHVDLVENKEASIYENPIPIYECLPQDKL